MPKDRFSGTITVSTGPIICTMAGILQLTNFKDIYKIASDSES